METSNTIPQSEKTGHPIQKYLLYLGDEHRENLPPSNATRRRLFALYNKAGMQEAFEAYMTQLGYEQKDYQTVWYSDGKIMSVYLT